MSENVNTPTVPTPAPIETVATITVAGQKIDLIPHVVKGRKKKDGTTSDDSTVIVPQANTPELRGLIAAAIIAAADIANPDKGSESLFHDFVFDRAKEATTAAGEAAAKVSPEQADAVYIAAYAAALVDTKVTRGDSLKSLRDQLNDTVAVQLTTFKALLHISNERKANPAYVFSDAEWAEFNAKVGKSFSQEEQIIMFSVDLDERNADLQRRIDKKEAASKKAAETKTASAKTTAAKA